MKPQSTSITPSGFDNGDDDLIYQIPNVTESSSETAITPSLSLRRYGFTIRNFHFLVPHGLFCELLVDINITPLPNSPSHLVGLSNHRGNIIPIYTLAPLLGLPAMKQKYVYLLGQPEDGAALLINDKPSLVNLIDAEKIENYDDNLPSMLEGCVEESQTTQGKTWHSLDHKSLFRKLAASR